MRNVFLTITTLALLISSCAVDINPDIYTEKEDNLLVLFEIIENKTTETSLTFHVSSNAKGADISYIGVCASKNNYKPTIKDKVGKISSRDGMVVISGLEPATEYICRACLATSAGTVYYSDEETFKTAERIPNVVLSSDDEYPSDMTAYGGEVEIWIESGLEYFNERYYSEYGVVYGTNHYPTLSDSKTPIHEFDGDDGYEAWIPMSQGQILYYRGYAIKKDGTVIYSDDENIIQTVAVTGGYNITSADTGSFYLDNGEGPYSYRVQFSTNYEYYGTSSAKELGFVVAGNSFRWVNDGSQPDTSEGIKTSYDSIVFNDYTSYLTYYAYTILNDDTVLYGEVKHAYFSL